MNSLTHTLRPPVAPQSGFFNRTPAPPPLPSMNSTPAASRVWTRTFMVAG